MSEVIIEATWDELGCKLRAIHDVVFLRTEKIPDKTVGGLYYAVNTTKDWDGPLHLRLQVATVLSCGPYIKGALVPGDRIVFQRKYLAWYRQLEDQTFVGWVRIKDVAGILAPDVDIDRHISFPEGAKAIRYQPT